MAGDIGAFVYHGTMVAGLVGASTNNGVGVSSVGWDANILPIQALNDAGEGNTFTIASAINYSVSKGAKVINLSLGSFSADPVMEAAINNAISSGVSVVAASGNSGCDCIIYPANYPNVIAVGATDINDNRASFSNYGNNLDIVAPGTGTIRTTFMSSSNKTSLYTTSANGTSVATPIVSGAIALVLDKKPDLTPSQIESLLRNGSDKVATMSGQNFTKEYGYGRLNALNLVCGNSVSGYCWEYAGQASFTNNTKSTPLNLNNMSPGQTAWLQVRAKNIGATTWYNSGPNKVDLATDRTPGRSSRFSNGSWLNASTPTGLVESSVAPGQTGTFEFPITIPAGGGTFREYFNPVAQGITFFNTNVGQFFPITVN
jgi:hypothetical protein